VRGNGNEGTKDGTSLLIFVFPFRTPPRPWDLQKCRTSPSQKLYTISTDLTSAEATSQAFEQYAKINDTPCPDYVVSCTGGAGEILGYFTDLTPELLKKGWETNYLTALWTAHVRPQLHPPLGLILSCATERFWCTPWLCTVRCQADGPTQGQRADRASQFVDGPLQLRGIRGVCAMQGRNQR